MPKYQLVTTYSTLPEDGCWQIHRLNCKDVSKMIKRGASVEIMEADSAQHLIDAELKLDRASQGYTQQDFKIMPCSKGKEK